MKLLPMDLRRLSESRRHWCCGSVALQRQGGGGWRECSHGASESDVETGWAERGAQEWRFGDRPEHTRAQDGSVERQIFGCAHLYG